MGLLETTLAILIAPCLVLGQASAPVPAPVPVPAPEMTPTTTEVARVSALEEDLARQRTEILALRNELGQKLAQEIAARQAADAQASSAVRPAVEAVLQEAPRVAGANGLSLAGVIQTDMYIKQSSDDQLNTSTGAPLNDNRFTLRRMRLRASMDRRYLAAIAEIDVNTMNGPQVRPTNMEVTAKLPGDDVPYVAATVGIFKIPFGFEIGQSDHERLFAERSNSERALFPGEYDLGARISGGWRFVRYALAIQNGEPLGESTFPARDPNAAKDVVGRLGITSPLGENVSIQAGFSALAGKGLHAGTPPTKPTVIWQDRNENGRMDPSEMIVMPGSTGLPSKNFSRNAMGADILLGARTSWLGKTTLYAEITWAKNLDRNLLVADPYGPLGRDLREKGYYLALVQDLTEYAQAGIRYDRYDPDLDSTDRQAATTVSSTKAVSTLAVAAAARMKMRGFGCRLLVQYDINRNHFGRNQAGLPTNLASNVFTLRAEAVF